MMTRRTRLQRWSISWLFLWTISLIPSVPRAELEPLDVITSGVKRPDIMIVLDTSGSMHWHASGDYENLGSDCNQDSYNIVDIATDGMCMGTETATPDCMSSSSTNSATAAGQLRECNRSSGTPTTGASRMFQVKRVLRNILPPLKDAANFGLVAFNQTGYFQYYRAKKACECNNCTSSTVCSCTSSNCESTATCPAGSNNPYWQGGQCRCEKSGTDPQATSCLCSSTYAPTCTNQNVCSTCTCANVNRTCKLQGSPPCCSCPSGYSLSCTNDLNCNTCVCRKTNWDAADCCTCPNDSHNDWELSDRCYETQDTDDCRCRRGHFRRRDRKRATCDCPPEVAPTCAASCPAAGASTPATCTTPTQKAVTFFLSKTEMEALKLWVNDAPKTTCNPASENCGWRDHSVAIPQWTGSSLTLLSSMATGTNISATNKLLDSLYHCTSNSTKERRWAFSEKGVSHTTSIDSCSSWSYVGSYYTYLQMPMKTPSTSCSSPDCQTLADYRGPQYFDGTDSWVYRRFSGGDADNGQGIAGPGDSSISRTGMVVQRIEPAVEQEFQDVIVQKIVSRMNAAKNGGFYPKGGTPTAGALKVAGDLFVARQEGTTPYTADEKDYSAPCRRRFAIVLTDGQSNTSDGVGETPQVVAQRLYKGGRQSPNYTNWNKLTVYSGFPDNPIQTLAVGIPGLDSYSELHDIADRGFDGADNNTPNSYQATNENELQTAVNSAILGAIAGDYVTTSIGVADKAGIAGALAILPSTKYPGWEGRLVAYDVSGVSPVEVWDAGEQLYSANADANFTTRPIYTGFPTVSSGQPIKVFNADGTVNLAGVLSAVTASGQTLPGTAAQQQEMLRWIAGKGRNWRLGPIFHSVPATVGDNPGYSGLEVTNREPLIYVTSHDGLLHAFRAADGKEMFAYLPPNLLPRIYNLWSSGTAPQRQDDAPNQFEWILGSSPRIKDIPDCTSDPCVWRTHLVLTMGASDNAFAVLDVTDPVDCTSSPCTLKSNFFKVVGHSDAVAGLSNKLGETWSIPALFYHGSGVSMEGGMAMASGYPVSVAPPANQGNYYFHFTPLISDTYEPYANYTPVLHTNGGSPLVDYAVMADTVGEVNTSHQILATYQGDLYGRLVRYPGADSAAAAAVIDDGPDHPFYYGPALYKGSMHTYIAAISGASGDNNEQPGVESKMYVLKDGLPILELAMADLCTSFPGAAPHCPSTRARPIDSPLLLDNKPTAGSTAQMEAWFLIYDPAPADDPCRAGFTYTIRIQVDTGGTPTNRLISVKKDEGRGGGFTIVGSPGTDVAISFSGEGENQAASVKKVRGGGTWGAGAVGPSTVSVDSWKEVR